jgi:hypothetical protein
MSSPIFDLRPPHTPTRRKFRLRLLQIVSNFGSVFFGNAGKMQIGAVQTVMLLAI